MAPPKNFNRRGKIKKFFIGTILYFQSPSIDGSRVYHYKQRIKVNGQSCNTVQITKKKYALARKRKDKKSIK